MLYSALLFLWVSSEFIFIAHVCLTHVIIAFSSAECVVWCDDTLLSSHCNFLLIAVRFLTLSCKVFRFFTVITFSCFWLFLNCFSEVLSSQHFLQFFDQGLMSFNHIKVHWIVFILWGVLLSSYSRCSVLSFLHLLFSLLTVDVNKYVDHLLKAFRSLCSDYFIFNSFFKSSIVLQCESFSVSLC